MPKTPVRPDTSDRQQQPSHRPAILPDERPRANGRSAAGRNYAATAAAHQASAAPPTEIDPEAPALVATDSEWDTNCAPSWLCTTFASTNHTVVFLPDWLQ